jgi:hypothetical protein
MGTFLSLTEFIKKYNIRTNFVEYGGVISAIKKSFPNVFDNPGNILVYPTIPYNLSVLLKDKKGSRRIYDILVLKKRSLVNLYKSGRISLILHTNSQDGQSFLIPLLDVQLIQS